MKRAVSLFISALILSVLIFSGCTRNDGGLDPNDPVTLTMWHNYGGDMQNAMDALIDEFNSTVGKSEGVKIDVTAISSGAQLNESLMMILNGDPGAPEMPDIFTGYPKLAALFTQKDMLAQLDPYFTDDELGAYIDEFIMEGRLPNGGLYVFPIAKSTEILYLNQTLFDAFAAETGASADELATFEGIARLAKLYYEWTDAKTPDIENDGKQFYSSDSWFNVAQVGMVQLGQSIFQGDKLSLENGTYEHIFSTLYQPAVQGGFAVYDGYSSDLSKTGDLVCSTGSSAGILFYGDTITYQDGTVESVEYSILPYPTFEGGSDIAIQRGGGLMVANKDDKTKKAASVFIKWFTLPEQNMAFISKTGYLPVTKKAFEEDMPKRLSSVEDTRIAKMLTAVNKMYSSYQFFTAPNFTDFDAVSKSYEANFKQILSNGRNAYLSGLPIIERDALNALIALGEQGE